MTNAQFKAQVEALWADYFGCSPDDFAQAGTLLLPRQRLEEKRAIHVVYIRKRALAEIDPGLHDYLQAALAEAGASSVLSSELLTRLWGSERITDVEAGLVFHLQPGQLIRPALDPQFVLRRLTPADGDALQALKKHCTEYELDDSSVELDHEIAWGCFKDSQVVAVGSGYRRNGFMDYGVLTDPAFRGLGLARHVVVGLADDTTATGLIAQYRCNRVNQASRRVAEAAGFTLYYTTESIQLPA